MSKKFILVIGIMVIVVAIMSVFAVYNTNNNTLKNDYTNNASGTYEIRVNGTGDWTLDIYSRMRGDYETFNGTGQETINIGQFNHLPNYALTILGNNTENITIEVLLNGKVVQTKTLTPGNNYIQVTNYQQPYMNNTRQNLNQSQQNRTGQQQGVGQRDRLRIHN